MPYGTILTDVIQSSTAGTPPQFNDGNSVQTGTLCRAWVSFTTVASATQILASFNVSSVTYTSAGNYVVNFSTAFPDAKYAVNTSGYRVADIGSAPTASNVAVQSYNSAFSPADGGTTPFCVSVFR